MNSVIEPQAESRALKVLGWCVFVLGLPIALLAALLPANEYEATLGINALDCDGPFRVYLFVVPALIIYGTGLVLHGLHWRRRKNLIVAFVCLAICVSVAVNLGRAIMEDREQSADCLLV